MKALIIANGTSPARRIVNRLASSADLVVCADGGADHARVAGIKPDIILGDLDSLSRSSRKFFHSVPMMFVDDQDSTDLEKALEFSLERGAGEIDIAGATGDRLDHTTGTLGCFKKFGKRAHLRLFDTVGCTVQIKNRIRFASKPGEKVSLIPLEKCSGVTTLNLRYPLKKEMLELGVREGVSNESTRSPVSVSVERGTLLLFRFYASAGEQSLLRFSP